ncbi:VWA domain-containing protein, partial [bacterium]|nr:VWA domain-containing protein [bacterium]
MRLAAAAAALLVLLGATPAGAGEELAIDDLSLDAYPEVTIDVTVPPDMASLDLLPGDFEVFVAGRRRSAAVWSLASRPTAVILVIDTSGSMDGAPMEGAVAAATAFLERLPETADVAVVSFGDTPTVTAEPGTSPSDAAAALSTLSAGGETSLYDAVLAAVRLYPVDAETRRILIVLSDGGDTVSSAPLATAVRGVELSNAELHMISLDSPEADIAPLETLATAGGTGVSSADTSGLSSVFESIGDTVLGRYRIVFATDATGPTEIAIQVRHQSFSASATTRAMFPVAPAVSAALPAPATTIAGSDPPVTGVPDAAGAEAHPQPSLIGSSWTLPAGVATVIGGVLALVLLTSRDGSRARASVADIAPPKRRRFKEVLASLSHGAETAADEVLRRRGSSAGIEAALDRAGLSIKPTQYAVAAVVSVIALGVAGSV